MKARPKAARIPQRRAPLALALAVPMLVALLAFAPSLRNGFVWDDRPLVLENSALAEPGATWKAFGRDYWAGVRTSSAADYYRPIAFVSLAADHAWHGQSPRGYHATNLLLHAAVALLLALFLLELGTGALQAGLGAALFAAHPALAEGVAWISGRTDPLAALFVLILLLADRRRTHAAWRAAAFLACAAALWAKEVAVVAPLLAVLVDVHAGRKWWPAVRRRGELWGLLGAYFLVRQQVLGAAAAGDAIVDGGLGVATRAAGLLHLPGILLAPMTSRLLYGAGLQPATLAAGAIAGAVLIGALVFTARRNRRTRPSDPLSLLVALGLCSLLPAVAAAVFLSGLADRLVYLPAVFLLPAVTLALAGLVPPRVATALAAVAIAAAAAGATVRTGIWRDDRTFFTRAAAERDAAAPAYYNLAIALHGEGQLQECDAALDAALARSRLPGALFLQGLLYYEIGCDDLALQAYREVLAHDRGHADAGTNLGALHLDRGEFDAAERVYRDLAQNAQPPSRRPEFNAALGLVETARAQTAFQPRTGRNCADAAGAEPMFRNPRELNRRGLELLRWRRLESARVVLTAALRLDPALTEAQLNLAQYHMLAGTPDRARALLLELQRRDPSDPRPARLLDDIARRAANP